MLDSKVSSCCGADFTEIRNPDFGGAYYCCECHNRCQLVDKPAELSSLDEIMPLVEHDYSYNTMEDAFISGSFRQNEADKQAIQPYLLTGLERSFVLSGEFDPKCSCDSCVNLVAKLKRIGE